MEINTSIVAAGVAQTGLQAQQLGRRRAARAQQSYRQTREIQEVAAAHLRAVDENDEGSSAGVHLAITADLPEHHTPQADRPVVHRHPQPAGDEAILGIEAVLANDTTPAHADAAANTNDEPDNDAPPIRHLDVKA